MEKERRGKPEGEDFLYDNTSFRTYFHIPNDFIS